MMRGAARLAALSAIVARLKPWIALAAFVAIVFIPWYAYSPVWIRQIELISITSAVVVGLNLSYGFAGELSLGQAAMYAAGGYITGILARHGHNDLLVTLPAAGVVAAALGLISGVPGLRLSGFALAMVSFFLILLTPDLVSLAPNLTGGFAGLAGIPDLKVAGQKVDPIGYYVVVVMVTGMVFVVFRNILFSRTGITLRVMKQSPILASSLGIAVYRTKLLAYVIGAIPAGIAGCLFAYLDNYIAPQSFGFPAAVAFLGASILGGSQSLYGAILGSALIQLGPLRSTAFQKYSLIAYGLFLVFGGIFFSGGFTGLFGRIVNSLLPRVAAHAPSLDRSQAPEIGVFPGRRLEVTRVAKQFGGVVALRSVTLSAEPGQITAIIGANGSGKTTLLNLISGFYRLDGGILRIGDLDLSRLPAYRIALAGVSRTFQTPAVPAGLTAAEVVASARYSKARAGLLATILRLPKYRAVSRDDRLEALRLLGLLRIDHLADVEAVSLPLGTRRLLEFARALASRPAVLLLDEPASGLDHAEIQELANAVRLIREADATVVIVEHNFPLVLQLADQIHVLSRGELIASGTPTQIRGNRLVAESYLGSQE
jgi:branched-chain amino acid transport system permease protein